MGSNAARHAMKVLHIIATNFVGGPEKQILLHAEEARRRQVGVYIGSFLDSASEPEILGVARKHGFQTLAIKSSGRSIISAANQIRAYIRANRIDVLCTHGYKANIVGWFTSQVIDLPRIAVVRGWTAETRAVSLYERVERMTLRRTRFVICVSRMQAEHLKRLGGRRQDITVIPNCVPSIAPDVLHNRKGLRTRFNWSDENFVVVSAGRLSREKGQHDLIEAVGLLGSKIPHLRVVILGEGRELKALRLQAEELGVSGKVEFAGFQRDVLEWLRAADLCVNPSLTEGVPNVVLESMSVGTPVLATAVGGVPDIVQDGISGALIPAAQPSTLADTLFRMAMSPSERQRLVAGALRALENLTPSLQCDRFLRVYEAALAAKARRK